MADITADDEKLLLNGVKKAVSLVDAGDSPNEALFKVATELKLTPGFLKAACTAFNTGRQLAQMQASQGVLNKMASFPLADFASIHRQLWGDSEKTAAVRSFGRPQIPDYAERHSRALQRHNLPSREKTAEVQPTGERNAVSAFTQLKTAEARVELSRQKMADAENNVHLQIHRLQGYFRKFAMDRLPLAQVEQAVIAMHGEPGRELVEYAATVIPGEKRASDHSPLWSGFTAPVARDKAPYTLFAAAISAGQQVKAARDEHSASFSAYEQARQDYTDYCVKFRPVQTKTAAEWFKPPGSLLAPPEVEKAADVFGAMDQLRSHIKGRGDSAIEGQIRELESPEHVNELRKIRAQTALTSLMSDPDSQLSEQDPTEVLEAYNELTQLAPSLSDQPAALRPMLQRRVVGNVEPFEVGETLKFEDGLQKTHPSTMAKGASLLQKAGFSLLDCRHVET